MNLEKFTNKYGDKVYPVNCYNPYENSTTLNKIKTDPNFIQTKPDKQYDYRAILETAFKNLNEAAELRKKNKYHKKIFRCCHYIKHKAFFNDPLFKDTLIGYNPDLMRGWDI